LVDQPIANQMKYGKQTVGELLKAAKLEMTAAFRLRCKAFRMLSAAFNTERNKGETFQPNWTSPSQASVS
jgi:hypothetical protein